jgi:thiamine-monophosphate kinase
LESKFVDWLIDRLPRDPRLEVPPGDDAAVLRPPAGLRTVVTVDLLTEGVDFILGGDTTPRRVGHKALAVNLSDLAAMGAAPEAVVVAVALPRSGALAIAEGLHAGIAALAARFGVTIAGGDTNSWDGPLVVSITAIGSVAPGAAWRRDGARPGDLLVVTGPCGGSLLGRHLDVEPRCREALDIAARFHVHAAIDSSDGLSLDVARLMRASGTRGVIDLHRVPVHPDADRRSFLDADGVTALDHALGDGEDFELILALPPADALALVVDPPAGIAPVIFGEVTSGTGLVARTADGSMRPLQPKGWLHEGT